MNMSRKLGMLVFCGMPAIVGGGIIYSIFGGFVPVCIYEIILMVSAGAFLSK